MTEQQIMQSHSLNNDEIDLRQVAAALGRHLKLIGSITAAAVMLSGIYAFTRKPIWEGEFQIVLENQDGSGGGRLAQIAASNPILAGISGINEGDSSLLTEVKILESPSVLRPVYEFVKSNKSETGNDVSKCFFSDWIKTTLLIELEKRTSVLSIVYRDTNNSLFLPVLQRITDTYHPYSVTARLG